jgi:hypothetical protein
MLVSPDGQERTADEFAALLANAGFRMEAGTNERPIFVA